MITKDAFLRDQAPALVEPDYHDKMTGGIVCETILFRDPSAGAKPA